MLKINCTLSPVNHLETVPLSNSPKHLGLNLKLDTVTAESIITKSRKTIYSLMGAGVHGINGINPIISRKIWERYNVPRSTHGLEVEIFSSNDKILFCSSFFNFFDFVSTQIFFRYGLAVFYCI